MKNLILCITAGLLTSTFQAHSMVIDSFTTGNIHLSLDGQTALTTTHDGPVGNSRSIDINSRMAATGSTLNCDTDSLLNYLWLQMDGNRAYEDRPLHLSLDYSSSGQAYDLSQYSAFALDFSDVSGDGYILVEVDAEGSIYDQSIIRTAITDGTVYIPFTSVQQIERTIDSFGDLQFTFVAANDSLSFQLGEIRAVPEPTSLLLLLGGAGILWLRRIKKD